MRYTLLFSIFLFVIFIGCKKNPGNSPTLKFKSVNTTELRSGNIIQFTLSFKGGSVNDSITVQEIVPQAPSCQYNSSFTLSYPLPTYPVSKNQDGEITITYGYNAPANNGVSYTDISPKCSINDTAVFRFSLKDANQHLSDTVSSPTIIIYYQ